MLKKNFRYLPPAPGAETWGMVVTGAGFFKTPPGSPYPPDRHPDDHRFEWEHGRVLSVFQILCIHAGRGELESNTQPPQKLVADSAFLLKPGQWHRFRPDPKTGWTESWIEFQGLVPNSLSGAGQLGEGMVVRKGAQSVGLCDIVQAVFERVCHVLPGIDPKLTALAMEALAAWSQLCYPRPQSSNISQALTAAIQILEREYRKPPNLEKLAHRVGMSYSAFRRHFQKHTEFAPWKYVRYLRLSNARHRLTTSNISLAELAEDLGFSSAFHLSTAFRKEYGMSPRQWKNIRQSDECRK
jgi:AraC-like DNA-binding protein